mmetsp:Transcript_20062/g.33121  ORF Transcript_20062/g.33121 Transcript_20062/m.33121 type:complete len:85 (+) Transcript_20062:31-285(+)
MECPGSLHTGWVGKLVLFLNVRRPYVLVKCLERKFNNVCFLYPIAPGVSRPWHLKAKLLAHRVFVMQGGLSVNLYKYTYTKIEQ